jgi:single-stranded DNA-binding protein
MLNTAWIAGVARNIRPREGCIQQTNNLNQMIRFVMDEGDVMPNWVKDGVNIKVVGRIHTNRSDGEPVVELMALAFETPSIYDMPPRAAWERNVREGVPTDTVRPDQFRPEDEQPKMGGLRITDAGNMVKVAGFVSSFFVEAAGMPKPDGGVTQGCLVLTLRQTREKDDLIPIRCYGPKAESLARRLDVGVPLKIEGKLRVRLKNTGSPADESGILPVHKFQYIHVSNLGVASRADIKEEPEWAKEMALEHRSKRAAQQAAKKAPATASTPESTDKSPEDQKKQTPPIKVMDADLNIDPEALKSLSDGKDP